MKTIKQPATGGKMTTPELSNPFGNKTPHRIAIVKEETISTGRNLMLVRDDKDYFLLARHYIDTFSRTGVKSEKLLHFIAKALFSLNPALPGPYIPQNYSDIIRLEWKSCQTGKPVSNFLSGLPADDHEIQKLTKPDTRTDEQIAAAEKRRKEQDRQRQIAQAKRRILRKKQDADLNAEAKKMLGENRKKTAELDKEAVELLKHEEKQPAIAG